ncbi:hypothetical protein DMUE_1063 [Dictyocoela muelleri]|nr:hypothetical protein DMUE_1063 [Dictyocoela muelleri]
MQEYELIYNFFERNFIKNKSFWSVQKRIIDNIPTTTNTCEAYHRHLNSKVSRKNSSLGRIIDIIKKEEMRTMILTQNLKSGLIKQKNVANVLRNIIMNYKMFEGFKFYETISRIYEIFIK